MENDSRPPQFRPAGLRQIASAIVLAWGTLVPQAYLHAQRPSKPASDEATAKAKECATCHGTSKSQPLAGMPSLAGQQAEFLGLQMFLIREKLRDVPQMAGMLDGLSDAELTALAAYFAGQPRLKAANALDRQLQSRGAALSNKLGCASCHMSDYSGQRQVPRLTGQREDYLAATLTAYRDNRRSGSDTSMNAVMYGVSDRDIAALAHYLAHL